MHGISVELIDVQTLVPFDKNKMILESIKKTNRIFFLDEDVPGGTTAYMMQEVLEKQGGWQFLDSPPENSYRQRNTGRLIPLMATISPNQVRRIYLMLYMRL